MSIAGRYIMHTTIASERWDLLAWQYYGDATQFSAIIMANPAVPIAPVLDAGTVVAVPIMMASTPVSANLPPWKRPQAAN
ncbi:MAG TPA: tail protein X [Candidatus Binataceae bacterium]|nr:tail protein X [Candidatus Binataceae bacterium]